MHTESGATRHVLAPAILPLKTLSFLNIFAAQHLLFLSNCIPLACCRPLLANITLLTACLLSGSVLQAVADPTLVEMETRQQMAERQVGGGPKGEGAEWPESNSSAEQPV